MSLPRYPAYKDSGVAGLGAIPAHWKAMRFSRIVSAIKDGTHGTYQRVSDGRPLLSAKNVQNGRLELCHTESLISESDHQEIVANGFPSRGDILLTIVGTIGRSCVYSRREPLAFQRSVCFLRISDSCVPQFFHYFIQSKFFQEQLVSRSKSAAQAGVYMGDVVATTVTCPEDSSEQVVIADFLDRETAKIDALIAEQAKLLTLLAEKRQATISHAVTRGLDPNAPTKDSGIPWLGEVPAHWQIANIKRLCELITDGAHVSPETEDGAFCFVSTKDVGRDGIDFEDCLLTSAASYEYLVKTGCQPLVGDVLFSKDGTVGRTTVVRDKKEFVVASSLIIIRPMGGRLDPNFLDYLCQSRLVKNQVEGFVKGAGLPRLSIQNLLKVVGVFPPLSEQRRISGFLAGYLERSDRLGNEVVHAVSTLKERRSALIAAAVTGQIDVRGLVEAHAA